MKEKLFIPKLCSVGLVFILSHNISHAMPGMHESGDSAATESPHATENLGEPINSSGTELEITYSADGKTAIFVSTREGSIESPGSPYNFDIWMSYYENDAWKPPIHLGPAIDSSMGPNINTPAWELEPSFSDDGNVIYFTRYEPGNMLSGDLYVVQKIDGVWQTAKNWNDVPELPNINTPTGEEHCPIIASDSLIYYSYHQPGVTQDSDIWKVEKKDGVWQEPESLGPKINSPYRDHMHWTGLSKDGKSLIITSMRPDLGSRGGHDEWIAHQDESGEWQEPINLGDTINTDGEDMCWTFTPDGRKFTGSWGPHGTYDMDIRWVYKDDIPLLRDFEPIGPPPNLLINSTAKPVTD
ncbi:PD40 domain-containing protein [Nitrosomonas marina]|uniref:WD40-like Beta Propeller Repeat n=1 Tax=Nitrosomonas marina TaxID=917 RepID=A0A1H8D6C6_9PROT|nr:PD40 domain-containing protein [Nitrosomonas marina]SEN02037.1 WD40-like Beta Propeller Repeat [Nitrosomonas marina]